jgi:hypothetical protein
MTTAVAGTVTEEVAEKWPMHLIGTQIFNLEIIKKDK